MKGSLTVVCRRANHTRAERFEEEQKVLRPLPLRPLPSFRESYATVSRASAVRVRLHADIVELHHRGERVAVMDRLIGKDPHRIDYRHIIHSLVRKPGALRRYVYRECLFPGLEFRRTYDALVVEGADRADFNYVRILHLAASDGGGMRTAGASLVVGRHNRADLRSGAR